VRTSVRSILQACVCDETDSCSEPFRVPQTIHDCVHLIAPQLILNALQCPLQTEPKVDLLRCGTRRNVPRELRNGLYRLNPLVYMTMQGIKERAVVEKFGWYIGQARTIAGRPSLLYCPLYDRVND
jgi:hypothetical protein